MVTWDAFYPYVRPSVQNCPIAYVDAAIRSACIEFCEKSLLWNTETICGDMLKGERGYKYNNRNDDMSIVMPLSVILRDVTSTGPHTPPIIVDHHMQNVNLQDIDTYWQNWRLREAEWPSHFYMKDSNTFIFVEKPTEDKPGVIHTLCAVKPSRKAAGVPDWILEDWAEAIAAGALARLMAMPSRTWGDVSMVAFYRSTFRAGIARAKSKMLKSYTTQSKRMLPKVF